MTSPNFRLGFTLWIAGITGVASLSLTTLPRLLSGTPLPIPLPAAIAASMLQSAVFLAIAVWLGVRFSRPLGLRAPVTEAFLARADVGAPLRRLLLPALLAGLATAGWLAFLGTVTPAELRAGGEKFPIPLVAKVLYGGVTEELLLRWGLMTLLIWIPWRLLQGKGRAPHLASILFGLIASALLFAAGHLPAVVAMKAPLTAPVVTYVLAGNALPGILFGILYWRRGIEASILAHALAHAVAVLVFL